MNKIMIFDDSSDMLDALQMIFELEDYKVITMDSGDGLLVKVGCEMPDIILLDIILGNLDGRDLCNDLKKEKLLKLIPIILMSASHGIESFNIKNCKPDGFMAKPFNVLDLTELVASKILN